jgi:hypothetical protein
VTYIVSTRTPALIGVRTVPVPVVQPARVMPVSASRSSSKSGYDQVSFLGDDGELDQPFAAKPGGVPIKTRSIISITNTMPRPMPSDETMETKEKPRALASERTAWARSRGM